jgi:hypothetical protein
MKNLTLDLFEKINNKISDENWTLIVQKLNQTKNIISLQNLQFLLNQYA